MGLCEAIFCVKFMLNLLLTLDLDLILTKNRDRVNGKNLSTRFFSSAPDFGIDGLFESNSFFPLPEEDSVRH